MNPPNQMKKQAILVVGMHRSGTSALTRVINLMGAELPEELYPSNSDNPTGYWEPNQVFQIHEEALSSIESAYYDLLSLPQQWFSSSEAIKFEEKIYQFLQKSFSQTNLFVIKDPRLCILLPLWEKPLQRFDAEIKCILPIRNPIEVASSLQARHDWSFSRSFLLWLKYVLEAERYSRAYQRAFVSYEELLENWQFVVQYLADQLDIIWPQYSLRKEVDVEQFLRPQLRHHKVTAEELNARSDASDWVKQVFQALHIIRADEAQAIEILDSIYHQWITAEQTFGRILIEAEKLVRQQETEFSQLNAHAEWQSSEIEVRDNKLDQMSSELEAKYAEITQLSEQIEAKNDELEVKTSEIEDWIAQIEVKQQRIQALEGNVYVLTQQLQEKEAQTQSLRQRLTLWQRQKLSTPHQRSLKHTVVGDIVRIPRWILTNQLKQKLKLRQAAKLIRSTNLFDADFYLAQNPDVSVSGLDPLEHYLEWGYKEGREPSPFFSGTRYILENPDVASAGMNPLEHYLRFGKAEGRKGGLIYESAEPPASSAIITTSPAQSKQPKSKLGSAGRLKLLFVSHEASLTGAPLIILTVMRYFARHCPDVELYVFLDKGGPVVEDFAAIATVFKKYEEAPFQTAKEYVLATLKHFRLPKPNAAFCNTANTVHYSEAFVAQKIPVFTLVHEFASAYDKSHFERLYQLSEKVIFPSRFVMQLADQKVPLPKNKATVLPQGLLNSSFANKDRQACRQHVCHEIGIPDDACIAVGCGSTSYRKGVDLFVSVAKLALQAESQRQIHFVWIGGGHYAHDTPLFWALRDVERLGLKANVHFIGLRSDPSPYYLAGDVFLLTSREDPFPCVVHEAMTCRLPVLAFQDAGGAPEAIADGGGIAVPYCDTAAMADALVGLANNPAKQQKIGEQGHEIVHRKYDFYDYFEALAHLVEQEANISLLSGAKSETLIPKHQQPKVFFTNRDWWISGVNSFTERLVRDLCRRGIDAQIIFPEFHSQNDRAFLPDVPHSFLGLEAESLTEQWTEIINFLEAHSPCILVPNYDYRTSAISPALSNKIGIIGIIHSDDVEHYDHVYRLGRYWNAIVAVSQHIAGKVVEINANFKDITTVIPYGINRFGNPDQKDFYTGQRPLRLVYCGRVIQHQKRVLDLLEIVERLHQRQIPFCLTVIGEGPELRTFQSRLKPLIRSGQVRLVGRLSPDQTAAELFKQDVFLLTSDFEGLPISLMEAMAQLCVPVVSNIESGVPELIQSGQNGLIQPVGDIDGFVNAIASLQSQPSQIKDMAISAFQTISEGGFRDTDMGAQYAEVIEHIWEQLWNNDYRRPEPILYKSPVENVSIPPSLIASLNENR
ncbi:MAG: glycosyltransferase [Thainema sp.]